MNPVRMSANFSFSVTTMRFKYASAESLLVERASARVLVAARPALRPACLMMAQREVSRPLPPPIVGAQFSPCSLAVQQLLGGVQDAGPAPKAAAGKPFPRSHRWVSGVCPVSSGEVGQAGHR